MNRWQGLGGDRDYEDEVSSGGYTFVGPFWFTAFFPIFLESRLCIPLGLTHPHFSSASKRLSDKLQRVNCDICGLELGECAHSEAEHGWCSLLLQSFNGVDIPPFVLILDRFSNNELLSELFYAQVVELCICIREDKSVVPI
jgi:hypothetical protein